jgi:hypothetical protein
MLIGETLLGLRIQMYSIISITLISIDDVYILHIIMIMIVSCKAQKAGDAFRNSVGCSLVWQQLLALQSAQL